MYDPAIAVAQDTKGLEPAGTSAQKTVYRKVDACVTVLLCGCYFFQFIDKSLLNYAAVMGIQLYLRSGLNQFSNLGTITYVGYLVAEPVYIWLFQRLPPAKLLGASIVCWGLVVVGNAFAKLYLALMAVRFFLGFFEVCVAPGCTLLTGMWYNPRQQLHRTCWWTCQAGVATIVGGLLSYAFQHVHSTRFESWQIFCLAMGILTVIWGVLLLWLMPDSPVAAKFLNPAEKAVVVENIRAQQTGTATREFKPHQVRELLYKDPLTWPMLLLTVALMIPTGAVLTFSATIIKNIGFSNQHAALMQVAVGGLTIVSIVASTYLCAYLNGRYRNLIFISLLVPALVGYVVLIASTNKIGQLLAVYLINAGTCVIVLIFLWNLANTAGYTKRVWRTYITSAFFAAGCLIGPQLFRAADAPRYIPAKVLLLCITAACIPLVLFISYLSKRANDAKEALPAEYVAQWLAERPHYQFMDLSDCENIMFRYSY